MESQSEMVKNTVGTFIAANGIFIYFLQPVLNFLWGLINCLQVIVLTSLFNMNEMPINVKTYMVDLLKMMAFDAFRTEEIILYVFNIPETKSYNQIFDDAGMEGSNFFALIGPLFLMVVVYSVYMISQLLIRYICWDQNTNNCLKKFARNKLHNVIIIRFVLESCIELLISASIAIYAQK